MPATVEPRSNLSHSWPLGESGWNTGMDANMLRIGRFGFHLSVKDRDLSAPPVSPAHGDTYIVGAAPTGDWATHADDVAIYNTFGTAGWVFAAPRLGWLCYIEDEQKLSVFKTAWSAGVAI